MNQTAPSNEIFNFLSDKEIKVFENLQKIIKELNSISNLTRLLEGNDYWISQVYDSVWPFIENKNTFFDNKKYIDIGSGGGFPGLAYAITHPKSEIYLLDSSKKKVTALKEVKKQLQLKNKITILQQRVESLAHDKSYRHKFDICTTRAVGSPDIVSEYIIPLLKPNGLGILYCGRWTSEKEEKLNKSLNKLNGSIQKKQTIELPHNKGERNIIFIKTESECPDKYPRGVGKPAKYPLGN